MSLPLSLNHVFVDYENVQAIDLKVIGNKGVTFTLLLGPLKKKLDVELVEQLFAHSASVELVRLSTSGRNALDFTLAYYIGRAVAADPTGFFHIISKDTGYDPMVEHLRSRHIRIRRHDDFSKLTFSAEVKQQTMTTAESPKKATKPAKPKAPATKKAATTSPTSTTRKLSVDGEPLARALENLRAHPKGRPKTRKKLVSHLSTVLRKYPAEGGVESFIKEMVEGGHIAIDAKDAVTYKF